jgi:hypothetical protein
VLILFNDIFADGALPVTAKRESRATNRNVVREMAYD